MIQKSPILFVIVLFVLLLALLWGLYQCFAYTSPKRFDKVVQILYRQCARWALAAEQDDSEVIRLLHANYATGYLWALKDIVSTEDFKAITGADFLELEAQVVRIQDEATRQMTIRCPTLVQNVEPTLLKAIYEYPDVKSN
jgi:hypothetical protein